MKEWVTVLRAPMLLRVGMFIRDERARRMSAMDLDRARKNFERLETETARRVPEFYEKRRNAGSNASAVDHSEAVCISEWRATDTKSGTAR